MMEPKPTKPNQNPNDDAITTLYEASLNGCVSTLNTLLQTNPLILNKISLSQYSETPLHISSLLGNSEFCETLLKRKPSLSYELDSQGHSPLHLASAEGHTQIVKALLVANPDTCMARDKDERIPLHYAAMRGRVGAIEELIRARPDSIQAMVDDDGSVMHLCIRYNHLEALKVLVKSVRRDQQFLLVRDREGNTILHLAVRLKQIKTIKYLLLLPEIRIAANALNRKGFTPLDELETCPRDFISLKIEEMLIEARVQRSISEIDTIESKPSQNIGNQEEPQNQYRRRKRLKSFWSRYLEYQGNWIEETRGTLMVVATVIATMTFQSTISPPGGVWQENTKEGFNCTKYGICEAGTSVLAYSWTHDFLKFMTFNTTSFFSSLCVVLLLISGFPLKNKVMMWVLTVAMTVSVTFMGLTYMWAQGLVTPDHILSKVYGMGYPLAIAWGIVLVLVSLIHTVRLVFWVRKRKKNRKKMHKVRCMSARVGPLGGGLLG